MIDNTELGHASGACWRIATACLFMLAAAFPVVAQDAPSPERQPPENEGAPRAIEGIESGHRYQPTPGALGKSDVSSESAKTVEELYKKLIEQQKDYERQQKLAPAMPGASPPPGNGG